MVKIRTCGVKNARKMSNLAVLFALHLRIFPQKTASQTCRRHALLNFVIIANFRRHEAGNRRSSAMRRSSV
ncbi:hypothetical protein BWD09_02540 [Neisseria dentiae]|uniref:Uncharacterized protein n=1 Tax=Neisseria dentiae TaxID=194197 RepID=A0A1X3DF19_9NEIS|nr:hypothetical protein BWD09_02540 [Neisseria dentiae]